MTDLRTKSAIWTTILLCSTSFLGISTEINSYASGVYYWLVWRVLRLFNFYDILTFHELDKNFLIKFA